MADKIPRVLKVESLHNRSDCYRVSITHRQWSKLPAWVQRAITWNYSHNNEKHITLTIYAVDEMQAFVRFQQLWIGLPKE